MKILTYEKFCEIVPKETKQFVDLFLKKIDFKFLKEINFKNYHCDNNTAIHLCIIAHSYTSLKEIRFYLDESNYDFNNCYMEGLLNVLSHSIKTNDNEEIKKGFEMLSNFFCVNEEIYNYYYLTPEEIILKNAKIILQKREKQIYPDSLDSYCFPSGIRYFYNKLAIYEQKKEEEAKNAVKLQFFSKLPIETINFLENSSTIQKSISNSNYSNDDIIALSLFLTLLTNNNSEYIMDYLEIFGLSKNDILFTIRKLFGNIKCSDISRYSYDIGNLIHSYNKFIDQNGNNNISDIVKRLIDRNISDSFVIEEILNKLNLSKEVFNDLDEKLKEYKENEEAIKQEKVLSDIYTKLPLNICDYIEFVSKIYDELSENNNKIKTYLSEIDILNISTFLSCFYKKPSMASYFIENGVSLEKLLKYFDIKDNDFDNRELNISSVQFVYENLLKKSLTIDIDKLCRETQPIDYILVDNLSLSLNASILRKILGDISNYYLDKENIFEDMNENFRIKTEKKKIELFKKFYGEMDIEVIKYIESSYLTYKKLLEQNNDKYTNDDLIELSLLLTAIYTISSEKYAYVVEEMFHSNLKDYLNFYHFSTIDDIFSDQVEIKEISKYYGKYIFGGKNKDKNKNEITIDDIFNNLFNKNLNDSYMLKILLNNYDLSYESMSLIDEKYNNYLISKIKEKHENVNFEVLNNLDKIYRSIFQSKKLEEINLAAATCSIATLIYLFYFENDLVNYLIDRGITLDEIAKYLQISKEEIDNFKNLETDFEHIKRKMSKFCYAGDIEDVIRSRMRCLGEVEFGGVLTGLADQVGTDIKELNYELLNDEKYIDYMKRKCLEIQQSDEKNNFKILDDSLKIYNILKNNCCDINDSQLMNLSYYIYLYYCDNDMVDFLLYRGITLEKICEYIKIDKEKLDNYKNMNSDYKLIYETHFKTNEIIKSLEEIIKSDILKINFNNSIFADIIKSTGNDIDNVKYELKNKERLLTREEKLVEYSNLPIPKLEINKLDKITDFGSTLTEQSELITKEFSAFIDKKSNNEIANNLQESISEISKNKKEKTKLFVFNKKKKEILEQQEEEQLNDKKELLNKLSVFLEEKEKSLQDGIKELEYIRKSIGVYLIKAKSYLNTLNEAKEEFDKEISNRNYVENDFRVFDDNLKRQMLTDKIANISNSIIKMLQQYQKVTMQMSTHATVLSQVNLARNTTIQNLYIELALNEGVNKEKESIETLNSLIGILANMTLTNESSMLENIEKINQISKNNQNIEINENDKLIMEQILKEQGLLEVDDKEKIKKINR